MTNNHVIGSALSGQLSVAEFNFEEGETPVIVDLDPDRLFVTHRDLDYTVIGCDPDHVSHIEHIALLRTPFSVTRHERVNIIQHPRGRAKEVALHNNKVVRILRDVIRYSTDTEPGSSGSAVFNNDWELVALHHAGFVSGSTVENEGIRMASVVTDLIRQMRNEATASDGLAELLGTIQDTSPNLGFFDLHGADAGREVTVADFRGNADFADLGFWNIEHFNRNVSDTKITAVASVIARLSLDVLGLVEVQQEAMDRLVDALDRQGHAADFELLNVSGGQDLAVLYDPETTTVTQLPQIADRNQGALNARTSTGRTAFPRKPMFARCRVAHPDDANRFVEFITIVVHLKAFGDAQSRERRRLAGQMLAQVIADIDAHENLPVVLGGDFNDRVDTDVFQALIDAPDMLTTTADDAQAGGISYIGGRRSLIDHILVSGDLGLTHTAGDDTAIVRLDQSIGDFADQVSDHVPLVMRALFRGDPVDPGGAGDGERTRIDIPDGAASVVVSFEE